MIAYERRDHVALATIDRPERRNALNGELCDELRGHVEGAHDGSGDAVRALVITGAGTTFCAGADLVTRFGAHGGGDSFRPAFEALVEAITDAPFAVIAAINGHALGAGMQLAVAADLRVATPGAKLGIPAAKLGVHLSPGNVRRLAQLAGQSTARAFLVGGVTIPAEDLVAGGLVHRLADDALADALAWADEIAALAPLSVSGHKHVLELLARAGDLDDVALADALATEARAFASEDLREGMAAFDEKRAPDFRGR